MYCFNLFNNEFFGKNQTEQQKFYKAVFQIALSTVVAVFTCKIRNKNVFADFYHSVVL